jgi:hypothetical protein
MLDPADTTLVSGLVSSLTDKTANGNSLIQSTAADRPAVGTFTSGARATVHTGTGEWLYTDVALIADLMDNPATANFSADLVVQVDALPAAAAPFVAWQAAADNNHECYIGLDSLGRVRQHLQTAAGTVTITSTNPVFVAGGEYFITAEWSAGVVSVLVNGIVVAMNSGGVFVAGTPTLNGNRFSVGHLDQTSNTLPFTGKVHEVILGPAA